MAESEKAPPPARPRGSWSERHVNKRWLAVERIQFLPPNAIVLVDSMPEPAPLPGILRFGQDAALQGLTPEGGPSSQARASRIAFARLVCIENCSAAPTSP